MYGAVFWFDGTKTYTLNYCYYTKMLGGIMRIVIRALCFLGRLDTLLFRICAVFKNKCTIFAVNLWFIINPFVTTRDYSRVCIKSLTGGLCDIIVAVVQ